MPIDEHIHTEDHAWVQEERTKQKIRLKRQRVLMKAALNWIGGVVAGIITTIIAYFLDRY